MKVSSGFSLLQRKAIWAIAKRDLRTVVFQPLFFTLLSLLTVVLSAVFYNGLARYLRTVLSAGASVSLHDALFQGHFATLNFFLLFYSSAFALKLITDEKRQRTLDLLWTSPVYPWQIMLSKFMAGITFMAIIIAVALVYPLSLSFYTQLDWGTLFSSCLGLLFIGTLYLANSMIIAAATQSSLLTIVGSLTLNFMMWLVSVIPELVQDPKWSDFFEAFSAGQHLVYLLAGQIKLFSIVFFVGAIALSFYTSVGLLKVSMLQSEGPRLKRSSLILLALSFVILISVLVGKVIFDIWLNIMSFGLGIGLLLLLGLIITEWQFLSHLFRLRRAQVGMNFGLQLLSGIIITLCLGYLAHQYGPQFDLSQNSVHSLSQESKNVVEKIKEPTEFIFIYLNDEMKNSAEKQIVALLDLYSFANPKLSYRSYNAYQSPEIVSQLNLQKNGTGLFVKMGPRFERISDLTEETVTNSLIRLNQSEQLIIYFVQGHGEVAIEGPLSNGQRSLTSFKTLLEQSYFKVRPLNLYESVEVPPDATALVIAGPQTSFSQSEIDTLQRYFDRGGKALFALEPLFEDKLTEFLEKYGFSLGREVIFDDIGRMLGYGPNLVTGVVQNKDQIVTASLDPQFIYYFMQASPVKLKPLDQNYKTFEWIRSQGSVTTRSSYSEKDTAQKVGQVTVIAGVQDQKKKWRVAVAGDVDFLQDNLIVQASNKQLGINLINFLTHDQKVLDIPSRSKINQPLQIPPSIQPFYLVGFIAYPMFFVVTGLLLGLKRKLR